MRSAHHLSIRALALSFGLAITVLPLWAPAQCTFNWRPGAGIPGVDGNVAAMTSWDPDGAGPEPELLVVGGQFEVAGCVRAENLAAWDGTTWRSFGAGVDFVVLSLAVFDGDLIVGGAFTVAGGIAANNIVRFDGQQWHTMSSGVDLEVRSLMPFGNDLIVGGWFNTAGGVAARNVARWDGARWHAMGIGLDRTVQEMIIYRNDLVVGGDFAGAVARWDGIAWQTIPGLQTNANVWGLAVLENDLIVGGGFVTAGGISANSVARWNGQAWSALGQGFNQNVFCLAVFQGNLYATGTFYYSGSTAISRVGRWNGQAWETVGGGTNEEGRTLYVWHDALFAGGFFDGTGVVQPGHPMVGCSRIVQWNGSAWNQVGSGLSSDTYAALAFQGDLYIGGYFRSIPGDPSAKGIARWDGVQWSTLGSTQDFAHVVLSMTEWQGSLIIGGGFTSVDSVDANRIARWDGFAWHPIGAGLPGWCWSLAVYRGELFAGGYFGVRRWTGASWQNVGGGLAGSSSRAVFAMTVYEDELIVAGNFTSAGGNSVKGIARWNGVEWRSLGAGMTATNWQPRINALTTWCGMLIAGGDFNSMGGVPVKAIAEWNGTSWKGVGLPLDSNRLTQVNALTVYNNDLIAGGTKSAPTFEPLDGIALFDGWNWRPIGLGTAGGFMVYVRGLANFRRELIAIGGFTVMDGQVSGRFARHGPSETCPADIGPTCGDSIVDASDLLEIIRHWGPCINCVADFESDGTVDVSDLFEVISEWGPCP